MSKSPSTKMTFEKPLGPNGTVITLVSCKAGSLEGQAGRWDYFFFFVCLGEKVVQRVSFKKIQKIENNTQNQLFVYVRHWDPLRTVPRGAVLKKHEASMKTRSENESFFMV